MTGFSTHRYIEIAPSSVSCAASFPPRGSLRYYDTLELLTTVDFYISHTGYANRLPLGVQLSGGQLDIQSKNSLALKVGRPKGPGRMRASLEDSTA